MLLAGCGVAYFAFHAVREQLAPGFVRESFPSVLAPLVMFAIVELTPRVRFRNRRIKYAVLAATTFVAVVWLEVVVPRWTARATGDASDAAAMLLGFFAFCVFDWIAGVRRSGTASLP